MGLFRRVIDLLIGDYRDYPHVRGELFMAAIFAVMAGIGILSWKDTGNGMDLFGAFALAVASIHLLYVASRATKRRRRR